MKITIQDLPVAEFATLEDPNYVDTLQCVCKNMAHEDGFDCALEDGTSVEPLDNGPWKNLLKCLRCGRVINQDTLEVVTRVAV